MLRPAVPQPYSQQPGELRGGNFFDLSNPLPPDASTSSPSTIFTAQQPGELKKKIF